MEQERSFFWSRVFVGGLVVCCAVLAVGGFLATFAILPAPWPSALRWLCVLAFAGVAGFSLGVAQMATAMAQALQGRPEHLIAFRLAIACAVLCGLVSLAGVHLGWCLISGRRDGLPEWWVVDIAGALLGAVKPAMTFVIEACRSASRADVAAAKAAADALDRAAAERAADADRQASLRRAELAARAPAAAADAATDAPEKAATAAPVASLAAERAKRASAGQGACKGSGKAQGGAHRGGALKAAVAAAATLSAASAPALAHEAAAAPLSQPAATPARPAGYLPSLDEIEQAREALHRRGIVPAFRSVAGHIGCSRHAVAKVWPKGVPLAMA